MTDISGYFAGAARAKAEAEAKEDAEVAAYEEALNYGEETVLSEFDQLAIKERQDADEYFNQYVFIDTETTGLDPANHTLLEISYAIGLGPVHTLYVHDIAELLEYADVEALSVNKYIERFAGDDSGKWVRVPSEFGDPHYRVDSGGDSRAWLNLPEGSNDEEFDKFVEALANRYWVGARPEFDYEFVQAYFAPETLNLKSKGLFDIRTYAAGVLRTSVLPSFSKELAPKYISLHQPDHTSAKDVEALREVFIKFVTPSRYMDTALKVIGA